MKNRGGLLSLAVLCWLLSGCPGNRSTTVLDSGPPADRIDLVVVGQGYADQATYAAHIENFLVHLFSQEPFAASRDAFNVYRLPLAEVDYAVRGAGSEDGLQVERIAELVRDASRAPAVDVVILLTPTEPGGGSSSVQVGDRSIPVAVFCPQGLLGWPRGVHELGHALGGLGDEYGGEPDRAPRLPNDGDLPFPNLTVKPESTKWVGVEGAGFFEGGYGRDTGVFRPFASCKMRDVREPFCPVCRQVLIEAIRGPAENRSRHGTSIPVS